MRINHYGYQFNCVIRGRITATRAEFGLDSLHMHKIYSVLDYILTK